MKPTIYVSALLTAICAFPAHPQTTYTIIDATGTITPPPATADANSDAWPDDPFALLNDGDTWYATLSQEPSPSLVGQASRLPARTVAARLFSDSSGATQTLSLDFPRSDGTVQRIHVEAPASLAQPGETVVVLVGVAEDLETLFGASQAPAIAPHDGYTLLPGGCYVEVSVLVSPDNGATYDELDSARLQNAPTYLRIENLTVGVDWFPMLLEHPTYIDSDPQTGIVPLAEPGAWRVAPSMALPYAPRALEDTQEIVYLEADLRALSVFAPVTDDADSDSDPTSPANNGGGTDTGTGTDGGDGEPGSPAAGVIDGEGTLGIEPPGTSSPLDSTSVSSETEPAEEGQTSALLSAGEPIWVDFGYTGTERGTEKSPFNALLEGVFVAVVNGSDTINIDRITPNFGSGETPTISTPLTINATNGLIRIGKATRVLYTSFTQWGAVVYDPVGSPMEGDLSYAINPEYRVYDDGDIVTLKAYAAEGLYFRGWWSPNTDFSESVTVDDLLPATTHRIAMDRDRYVWAIFGENTENYDLADPDEDGLPNFREAEFGTDPNSADTDGDGLPDGWEVNYGLHPLSAAGDDGAAGDPDGDSVSNADEYAAGTSPIFDESSVPAPPDEGEETPADPPPPPSNLNPDFSFADFSSTTGLRVVRDASVSGAEIHLVPDANPRAGAVWTAPKVPVAKGFSTTFVFALTNNKSDGISLVIQNSSANPELSLGGFMGYEDIVNSLAIEIDTFRNTIFDDPLGQHVSVHTRGPTLPNRANEDSSIGSTSLPQMTFGTHSMNVSYNPDSNQLQVRVDGILKLDLAINLETALNLDDGNAYLGVMATTGTAGITDGPTRLLSWSADFITSPDAADLRLVRLSGSRVDTGAAIEELEPDGTKTFEDFDGGFTEWGQPDAYPFQLEQQGDANPDRGEYPRSFDVYFDQVAQTPPNDNFPAAFVIDLMAFIEGGFPESTYSLVWSFEPDSVVAGRLVGTGNTASLTFDADDPPVPGLYKIRCEARLSGEASAPLDRTAVADILLPYAGPEIADWLIEEARQIVSPGGVGDQWVDHVENNAEFWTILGVLAGPLASQIIDFKNRAFTSVSWNYFDYTGHTTFSGIPPTPRFNFDDSRRASIDPQKDDKAFNDPSYATLNGLGIARQKITNVLWAVWGRSVGFSLPALIAGSNANNLQKLKFEDKSSNNSVILGSDLYQAIVDNKSNAEILSTVLTKQATRGIQADGALNDIRLWPRPDATAPPHTALWSYDPDTETTFNLDDGLTWTRPDIFRRKEEMDLLLITNP